MSDSINEGPIILNLYDSSDAKSFPENNLIHRREYRKVIDEVNERIGLVGSPAIKINSNERKRPERKHDTITILGTRGSGKTSFLRSILNHFCYDKKDSPNVEVFDIIDPTLIEQKGHVFLDIISLIQENVDRVLDKRECDPTNSSNQQERIKWKTMISQLAAGIPSMDGVGGHFTDSNWQDPEYIMNKGLKAVSTARKLEDSFNEVIEKALSIIGKKVFLIAFDDIDIDFKKGWPVLETIRKYCTSPRIIVLLSGDMNLFSLAIRKQQWKNFGKALLVNEAELQHKIPKFNELVTEMEGQYMQKVMKSEKRIHLKTLNEKLQHPDYNLYINEISPSTNEIRKLYDDILSLFGINNEYQAEAYRSFLLSIPLRSQIQFLKAFFPLKPEKENEKSEFRLLDKPDIDSVTNAFLSELYDKQVDIQLITSVPKFLNIVILQLLVDEKVLSESYQLQPTTTDKILNSSLIALNFLLSQAIRTDPSLIFDYLIRIGLTRNLLSDIGYLSDEQKKKTSVSTSEASIEGLCQHAALLKDKVLRDSVGLLNAYIDAYFSSGKAWGGIIRLNGFAEKRRRKLVDRLDSVFENKGHENKKSLGYFPVTILNPSFKRASEVVYSIYTLLATIGELIKKDRIDVLGSGILELSQRRSYSMPDFKRGTINTAEFLESDEQENSDYTDIDTTDIETHLKIWLQKSYPKTLSPHLLGKIATRMYYAFEKITDVKSDRLGTAMHKRIITFLNAVLVEDIKENASDLKNINIDNAVDHNRVFVDNLDKAIAYSDINKLYFSRWMMACPILLPYINPVTGKKGQSLKHLIRNFCGDLFVDNCLDFSVFNELELVTLKGIENEKKVVKLSEVLSGVLLQNNYDELISHLKNANAPFNLFKTGSKAITTANNRVISNQFPKLFGSKDKQSGNIRKFRTFLKDNNISW